MTDDPRIPPPEVCVLRDVLDRRACHSPHAIFVRFPDGSEWRYADIRARVRRLAAAFQLLGVEQGEAVISWLPNGAEGLLTFFALNYIGAVHVPINTAYVGALLEHVIANSGAKVIVASSELIPRLADIATVDLATVVTVGAGSAPPQGLSQVAFDAMAECPEEPRDPARPIQPWDLQSIIYTSGTTGPSKGVLSSYLHAYAGMSREAWPCVRDDDRFLVNLPMFHIGGTFIVNSMLCRGGSIALVPGFKTDSFWQTVRDTGSTAVFLLGVMGSFLMKQPPRSQDRDHTLRMAFMVPYIADGPAFAGRFGVDVHTIFNMTEIATPVISSATPAHPGTCGHVRAGCEVRLVDENDCEVPDGTAGEMMLRMDCPWSLSHGYHGNPEATAKAWRNGWFHTGDAFRREADGSLTFVDRLKDAIRRRGENISSFEVEAAVNEHPDVQETAAIPVPSAWGEDEVMIVLAARPGCTLDPAAILGFLRPRMAAFMLPRYVRIVDALPKTPTAKVQKAELRAVGVTPDTWDREA